MKLPTLLAATLLAMPLAVRAAHAQAVNLHVRTAGDLAEICGADPRSPVGVAKLNYCSGFAQGAVDVEFLHVGASKPFCIPPNVKREVTLHEFVNWVRAIPAHASENAVTGLFRFLAERYPCK